MVNDGIKSMRTPLSISTNPSVCVCVLDYMVYEDTDLYNDMGMKRGITT